MLRPNWANKIDIQKRDAPVVGGIKFEVKLDLSVIDAQMKNIQAQLNRRSLVLPVEFRVDSVKIANQLNKVKTQAKKAFKDFCIPIEFCVFQWP